ncbi:hypothetical protein [Paracoccus laeviglucosivorans]|uniref:Uncharacterized protein n=1 Tax=Paracoccus laeviglucosivorans TaxID=1197861 RepID=A0A521FKR8_9RHOB|nr:hypothetical protein [Paracoccus laeviglucosivorans]SMO96210.1 hypothetical protein SAMN06265221_12416 [Paracoccus laeviglucosivorans]
MRGPKQLGPYADRALDCKGALEEAVLEIADQAATAGWMRDEIWSALGSLAANILQADVEAEKTDQQIEQAIRDRLRKN